MGVGQERHICEYLRQGSHEAHWAWSTQVKGMARGALSHGHQQGLDLEGLFPRAVRFSVHFGQVYVFVMYLLLSISDVLSNSA